MSRQIGFPDAASAKAVLEHTIEDLAGYARRQNLAAADELLTDLMAAHYARMRKAAAPRHRPAPESPPAGGRAASPLRPGAGCPDDE